MAYGSTYRRHQPGQVTTRLGRDVGEPVLKIANLLCGNGDTQFTVYMQYCGTGQIFFRRCFKAWHMPMQRHSLKELLQRFFCRVFFKWFQCCKWELLNWNEVAQLLLTCMSTWSLLGFLFIHIYCTFSTVDWRFVWSVKRKLHFWQPTNNTYLHARQW